MRVSNDKLPIVFWDYQIKALYGVDLILRKTFSGQSYSVPFLVYATILKSLKRRTKIDNRYKAYIGNTSEDQLVYQYSIWKTNYFTLYVRII